MMFKIGIRVKAKFLGKENPLDNNKEMVIYDHIDIIEEDSE